MPEIERAHKLISQVANFEIYMQYFITGRKFEKNYESCKEKVAGWKILVLVGIGQKLPSCFTDKQRWQKQLCVPHIYACVFPLHTLHSCKVFLEQRKCILSAATVYNLEI